MPDGGWPLLPFRFRRRFVFQKRLGGGGMGAVFLAIDEDAVKPGMDDGRRAIKVVQRQGGPDTVSLALRLFDSEASAAKMLAQSKQYVEVMGFDAADPPYLSMRVIDDPTLTRLLLETGGSIAAVDVATLGVQILDALSRMHSKHWVHRDLKPDNIFASRTAGSSTSWRIRIADLGLWQEAADAPGGGSIRGSADILPFGGTPDYMSPEQLNREPVTCRADIHAVGSILWHAAVGTVPFQAVGADLNIALAARYEASKGALVRPASMHLQMFDVLKRALAFKPEDRFSDAEAMKAALAGFLSNLAAARTATLERVARSLEKAERKLASVRKPLAEFGVLYKAANALASELTLIRENKNALEPDDLSGLVSRAQAKVDALERDFSATQEMTSQRPSPVSDSPVSDTSLAATVTPSKPARLFVLSSGYIREIYLTETSMTIGRTDENDIVINHYSVSRNHAKISRLSESESYSISDLQSTNAVRVNGLVLAGSAKLLRGDVIDLGLIRMRFVESGEDFQLRRDAKIEVVPVEPDAAPLAKLSVAAAAAVALAAAATGVLIALLLRGGIF
ncbi:MAG: protein kinase [Kofleriaceae bacterium]|nr:protein kinase [Kofleriaceae bacterium]MBP9166298.1 protein kinase [Kofleriaceae bacterium]